MPPATEYNSSSAHFVSALRQNVHIWDATSGEYVRKLTNVSTGYVHDKICKRHIVMQKSVLH